MAPRRATRSAGPRIDAAPEAAIRAALTSGKGIEKVAAQVGVGTGTVQRIKAEMAA
jgi:transposase